MLSSRRSSVCRLVVVSSCPLSLVNSRRAPPPQLSLCSPAQQHIASAIGPFHKFQSVATRMFSACAWRPRRATISPTSPPACLSSIAVCHPPRARLNKASSSQTRFVASRIMRQQTDRQPLYAAREARQRLRGASEHTERTCLFAGVSASTPSSLPNQMEGSSPFRPLVATRARHGRQPARAHGRLRAERECAPLAGLVVDPIRPIAAADQIVALARRVLVRRAGRRLEWSRQVPAGREKRRFLASELSRTWLLAGKFLRPASDDSVSGARNSRSPTSGVCTCRRKAEVRSANKR